MHRPNKKAPMTYYITIIITFMYAIFNIAIGVYFFNKYNNSLAANNVDARYLILGLTVFIGALLTVPFMLYAYFSALFTVNYLTCRFYGQGSFFKFPSLVFGHLFSLLHFIYLVYYCYTSGDTAHQSFIAANGYAFVLGYLLFIIFQIIITNGMMRPAREDPKSTYSWYTLHFKPFLPESIESSWMPSFEWTEMDDKEKKLLHNQSYSVVSNSGDGEAPSV